MVAGAPSDRVLWLIVKVSVAKVFGGAVRERRNHTVPTMRASAATVVAAQAQARELRHITALTLEEIFIALTGEQEDGR